MKMILDLLNPAGQFRQNFRVIHASTPNLKNHCFAIRHKVYCEELKYEPETPSGLETDIHDETAIHVLIQCKHTGQYAGCVRIVRPSQIRGLPMMSLPGLKINEQHHPDKYALSSFGEVSRLAVMSAFRNRKGEHETSSGVSDNSFDRRTNVEPVLHERRHKPKTSRFPYIPLGLYLGLIELCRREGIDHLYMLTEARLAQHFAKLGVRVHHVGNPIEHRGERVPSLIHAPSVIVGMRGLFKPLYHEVVAQLDSAPI